MAPKGKNIDFECGTVFNRWTVIKRVENKGRDKQYLCECECGTIRKVVGTNLKNNRSISCGCQHAMSVGTHLATKHPLFGTWRAMNRRCYNKKSPEYKYYGKRGIKICNRWRDNPHNFFEDMGEKPTKHHTLDRIDPDGNYEPSNCRWTDRQTQAINRRDTNKLGLKGVRLTKSNKYVLRMVRNGVERRSRPLNSITPLKSLRESWENEYKIDSDLWLKNTQENKYDRGEEYCE